MMFYSDEKRDELREDDAKGREVPGGNGIRYSASAEDREVWPHSSISRRDVAEARAANANRDPL